MVVVVRTFRLHCLRLSGWADPYLLKNLGDVTPSRKHVDSAIQDQNSWHSRWGAWYQSLSLPDIIFLNTIFPSQSVVLCVLCIHLFASFRRKLLRDVLPIHPRLWSYLYCAGPSYLKPTLVPIQANLESLKDAGKILLAPFREWVYLQCFSTIGPKWGESPTPKVRPESGSPLAPLPNIRRANHCLTQPWNHYHDGIQSVSEVQRNYACLLLPRSSM